MGYTTLTAKEAIKKNEPIVEKALDKVMKDTPVLAKRDPVLHKFGVQAFKPVIAEGQAIEIHPLVTGGFNADFDGDTMGIFAPASKKAIEEAKTMLPSNNLFNPTYGSTMYAPGHEAQVGIYRLAQKGKKTNIKAKDEKEVSQLLADEKIKFDDQITVGGKQTTAGRLMLDRALPQKMRGRIAYSGGDLDKKAVKGLLSEMAHTAPKEYPDFVHQIKDLGNAAATQTGLTISLKDIKANKQMRDQFFSKAKREEEKIRAMKGLSKKEKDKRIVDTYRATLEKFDVAMKDDLKKRGSSLIPMLESGGISKWVQMKQLTGAPVMFEDAKGDAVPVPVLRSYGEGLRLADFMTAAHGARMGTLSKSQGTSAPGFLSKEVINSTMNVLVADKDCGTKKGINMNVDDDDFIDRFLAADVNMGKGKVFKAGTQITPEVRDSLRNNGKSRVTVRSPLKCAHGDGLCQKCTGVADDGKNWDVGTNIGVIAAQALGEPATQMAMNAFHTGGVIAPGQRSIKGNAFRNASDLLHMKKTVAGSAKLAPIAGKIKAINKDPAGGFRVHIEGSSGVKQAYTPQLKRGLAVGKQVKAGDALSDGLVNPHELLPLAGLDAVKGSVTNQLKQSYRGIRRRHIETVARSLTDLARVEDAGDNEEVMPGDMISSSKLAKMNANLPKGKKPATFKPVLKGVNYLPLHMQEDWAAKLNFNRLKGTIIDGALQGHQSDLHGRSPVPGMMYGAEFGLPPSGSKTPY